MRTLIAWVGTALMFATTVVVGQNSGTGEPRGELLYSTYCIGCHTTQVHWREKRLATDWASLKFQVQRWQRNVAPGLAEDEVAAIARYLNDLYYHVPVTNAKQAADDSRRVVREHRIGSSSRG